MLISCWTSGYVHSSPVSSRGNKFWFKWPLQASESFDLNCYLIWVLDQSHWLTPRSLLFLVKGREQEYWILVFSSFLCLLRVLCQVAWWLSVLLILAQPGRSISIYQQTVLLFFPGSPRACLRSGRMSVARTYRVNIDNLRMGERYCKCSTLWVKITWELLISKLQYHMYLCIYCTHTHVCVCVCTVLVFVCVYSTYTSTYDT